MGASAKRARRKDKRRQKVIDSSVGDNVISMNRAWRVQPLVPATPNQRDHIEYMITNDAVFVTGKPGTGKTYISVGFACRELAEGRASKIIFCRSIEEVGKSIGTLPGEIDDKIGWSARPFYDIASAFIGKGAVECSVKKGTIEHVPVSHIRGMSFPDDTIVIVDEAQNLTSTELKAIMTRVGHNNKIIICGDSVTQKDIRGESGLEWLIRNNEAQGRPFPTVEYGMEDCQRSALCKQFLEFIDKSQ